MLILACLALAVLVVLLVWLLAPGDDGGPASPALPDPTLALERGGFRYSIGVGPLTPATAAPGSGPVRPGPAAWC